jgi:hypothetical protein
MYGDKVKALRLELYCSQQSVLAKKQMNQQRRKKTMFETCVYEFQ